jgi:hypothetical protein
MLLRRFHHERNTLGHLKFHPLPAVLFLIINQPGISAKQTLERAKVIRFVETVEVPLGERRSRS